MNVGSGAKLVREKQFVSLDAASLIEVARIEMERNAKQSQDTNLHSSFNAFPDGPRPVGGDTRGSTGTSLMSPNAGMSDVTRDDAR